MSKKKLNQPQNKSYSTTRVLGELSCDLNQPSYTWSNDYPLWFTSFVNPFEVEGFELDYFPLVEDFEIRLEEIADKTGNSTFYQVWFFSQTLGYLARFWGLSRANYLAKNEVDDFSIPLGSLDTPYQNCAQGWELIIGEQNDFVYLMEGNFNNYYERWFKVSKTKYSEQWQLAIKVWKKLLSEKA
ncbi:MAG: hypothetical protein RMY34_34285 [Aulosira sp. DedQUE10]|nr:hypothetical protein [Aulosira sp. DedQUE10]